MVPRTLFHIAHREMMHKVLLCKDDVVDFANKVSLEIVGVNIANQKQQTYSNTRSCCAVQHLVY